MEFAVRNNENKTKEHDMMPVIQNCTKDLASFQ